MKCNAWDELLFGGDKRTNYEISARLRARLGKTKFGKMDMGER